MLPGLHDMQPLQEKNDKPNTPLILGRSDKIKDKVVEIKDIDADYGKVCIEGDIVFTDKRELRTGKTLATYAIYDGTSTIVCKSFLEASMAKGVLDRINNAKGLKVVRKCAI